MSHRRDASIALVFLITLIGGWTLSTQAAASDAPALVGIPNRIVIFRKDADGGLSYNSAVLSKAFEGWKKVPQNLPVSCPPAATALGDYIYIVACAQDGTPWMNQIQWGGSFVGWQDMHGLSSSTPAALWTVGKWACVVEVDYQCWVLGGGSKWATLPTGSKVNIAQRTDGEFMSGAAIGDYNYLASRGKDNYLWINQFQIAPGQFHADFTTAVGWISSHDFQTDTAPALVTAGNRTYMFAKSFDGRVFYNSWVLGGGGVGWKEMEGNGHISSAPAVAAVGSHIFVAGTTADGTILLNQADAGHPFGQWFPVR